MVAFIIVRTIFQDFSRYNRVGNFIDLLILWLIDWLIDSSLIASYWRRRGNRHWRFWMENDSCWCLQTSRAFLTPSLRAVGQWYSSPFDGVCYNHAGSFGLYFPWKPRNNDCIHCIIPECRSFNILYLSIAFSLLLHCAKWIWWSLQNHVRAPRWRCLGYDY